jgi:ethanolamine utilization protein EutQ (cupin superfamily)
MIDQKDIIRQLAANAAAVRSLLQTISDEQAEWKPNAETWCMKEVMEHVYNEERIDFRKHLKEMFSNPPQPWGEFRREDWVTVQSCRQALEGFLEEREASLAWLAALEMADWNLESRVTFGPENEVLVLHAGDVFASWAAHDYLHIRQMNELLFAWNEQQALPYAVQYAGGW